MDFRANLSDHTAVVSYMHSESKRRWVLNNVVVFAFPCNAFETTPETNVKPLRTALHQQPGPASELFCSRIGGHCPRARCSREAAYAGRRGQHPRCVAVSQAKSLFVFLLVQRPGQKRGKNDVLAENSNHCYCCTVLCTVACRVQLVYVMWVSGTGSLGHFLCAGSTYWQYNGRVARVMAK